jgi:UDP:flavonoid glycosyltransferase YjiC (YdhE family)
MLMLPFTTARLSGAVRNLPVSARQHVVFAGLPAYGHMFPLLPLAAAVRAAGHDVSFVTGPAFVPVIQRQGFPAHPAGVGPMEVAAELFSGPVPRRPDGGPNRAVQARLFLDALPRRSAPELIEAFRSLRPDLVVYEHTAVGAAIAAAVVDTPAVAHGVVAGAATEVFDPMLAPDLPGLLAEFGLLSADALRPVRTLDPFPRSLRSGPVSRYSPTAIQPVAWRDPYGVTPSWLTDCRRPVVYLTLGTIFGTGSALRMAMEALGGLDVDVLVALGPVAPEDLGAVPETVHVERFVDQARILPLVDLVVHHGGAGTTLGAAAAGLPQMILPSGADQRCNGEAVSAAGVGKMLAPNELSADRLQSEVAALLGQTSFAAAAQRVRREIAAMPAPDALVSGLVSEAVAA